MSPAEVIERFLEAGSGEADIDDDGHYASAEVTVTGPCALDVTVYLPGGGTRALRLSVMDREEEKMP